MLLYLQVLQEQALLCSCYHHENQDLLSSATAGEFLLLLHDSPAGFPLLCLTVYMPIPSLTDTSFCREIRYTVLLNKKIPLPLDPRMEEEVGKILMEEYVREREGIILVCAPNTLELLICTFQISTARLDTSKH